MRALSKLLSVPILVSIAGLPTGCATAEEAVPGGPSTVERSAENEEILEVRRRLKVMRYAVEAFTAAGEHEAADQVERAMHARELAIEGRRDSEALEVREAAPNRGVLSRYLAWAATLERGRDHAERARALEDLARLYAEQWRLRQGRRGAEGEEVSVEGLGDLNVRLEILRHARHAYLEIDDAESARYLERALHVGELQLAGAAGDEIAAAFEGLSMGLVIEHLQGASGLWAEWGHETKAARCNALAEHYARREREANGERGAARDREREEALRQLGYVGGGGN